MDLSAPHVGLVIIAYLVSAICLAGLCFVILLRDYALTKKLRKQNPKVNESY